MNNSLNRLIDGMVATLRQEVIPHIGTEFARGQAFGVIYMLKSIQLRGSWSSAFLREQITAQVSLGDSLQPLLAGVNAPDLPLSAASDLDNAGVEALRDANEARICALIDWHGHALDALGAERHGAIEAQFRHYMDRQLKLELQTSAKPMFAEMSSGSE